MAQGRYKTKPTTEQVEKITKIIGDGEPILEVVRVLGISFGLAKRWVTELGLQVSENRGRKSRFRQLSKEDIEGAISEGLSMTQMAEKWGVTYWYVRRTILSHGLTPPKGYQYGPILSDRDLDIRALRDQNLSLREIGEKVGLTREGVRLSLKKQGVEPKWCHPSDFKERSEKRKMILKEAFDDAYEEFRPMILADLTAGKSIQEMDYPISKSWIAKIARGLPSVVKADNDAQLLEEVKELYLSGLTMKEVADIKGKCVVTIFKMINKLGISRPAGRRKR